MVHTDSKNTSLNFYVWNWLSLSSPKVWDASRNEIHDSGHLHHVARDWKSFSSIAGPARSVLSRFWGSSLGMGLAPKTLRPPRLGESGDNPLERDTPIFRQPHFGDRSRKGLVRRFQFLVDMCGSPPPNVWTWVHEVPNEIHLGRNQCTQRFETKQFFHKTKSCLWVESLRFFVRKMGADFQLWH